MVLREPGSQSRCRGLASGLLQTALNTTYLRMLYGEKRLVLTGPSTTSLAERGRKRTMRGWAGLGTHVHPSNGKSLSAGRRSKGRCEACDSDAWDGIMP